jgi:uncharacterized protein (DUF433 family)
MDAAAEHLGVGLYSLRDVARIIGEETPSVRRWANGYSWRIGERVGQSDPVLSPDFPGLASRGILTFLDLIELRMVSFFRRAGISMQTIRAAARIYSRWWNTRHPFASSRIRTDGYRLFADYVPELEEDPGARPICQELPQCQLVIREFAEPFLLHLDFTDEIAAHYWPLGKDRSIVLDPSRSFGKPIVDPEGVPTRALYLAFLAGESRERIAWWYEVRHEAVADAISFEQALAAA